AELVDVDAEAVEPGVVVLLDEAPAHEGLEEPVRRRLGDPEAAGDVGDPELAVRREALEDVEGRADRLQAATHAGGRGALRCRRAPDARRLPVLLGATRRWNAGGDTGRPAARRASDRGEAAGGDRSVWSSAPGGGCRSGDRHRVLLDEISALPPDCDVPLWFHQCVRS